MLPLSPPLPPMLAKNSARFPKDDGWIFEPKWDGFRVVIFRDGDDLYLQSRSLKPLLRYFPELDAPLKAALPERCVVDGELIIAQRDRLDFDALQMRLHPAASRIDLLANKTPAQVVAWDLLALGDETDPVLRLSVRADPDVSDGDHVPASPAGDPGVEENRYQPLRW